jgi:hypothetical protein
MIPSLRDPGKYGLESLKRPFASLTMIIFLEAIRIPVREEKDKELQLDPSHELEARIEFVRKGAEFEVQTQKSIKGHPEVLRQTLVNPLIGLWKYRFQPD